MPFLAPLAIPLMIGGIGLGVTGAVMQGQAAAQQGKDQQAMMKYNAQVEEQKAKQLEAKAAFDQMRQSKEAGRRMSALEAGIGASGAISTEGSPLLIQAEQYSELELDNLMIGYEGAIGAGAARNQAQLDIAQGKMYRKAGQNRAMASYIGAGATLLTGLGSMGAMGMFGKGISYGGNPAVGGAAGQAMPSAGISPLSGGW